MACGRFLLNHHGRGFAQDGTFLYLLYDVLRIRHACLGSSLYTKRRNWGDVKAAILRLIPEYLSALAEQAANGRAGQIFDPDVQFLRSTVQCVGKHVSQSFGNLIRMRLHLRAYFVADGML